MWKNRIVRHGREKTESLLANEWNWRIHPEKQQEALKQCLDDIGWIQTVIINLRTSSEWEQAQGVETMLDGHARVKLALRHDEEFVPVTYVDLSPKEEKKALIALDRITQMAGEDSAMLFDLVNSLLEDGEEFLPTIDELELERIKESCMSSSNELDSETTTENNGSIVVCPECGHQFEV